VSTKWTTAANAIVLQFSGVVWVLLFAPLVLREPFRTADALAITVAFVGIGLFFAGDIDAGGRAGDLMALLSGLTLATLRLSLQHERERGAQAAVIAGNALVTLVLLPWALTGPAIDARDAGLLALLGAVQLAGAYVLFLRGIRHVPATEAALIGMLEPVMNPVWVFLALGERPRPAALAGAALVLGAIAWRTTGWGARRAAMLGVALVALPGLSGCRRGLPDDWLYVTRVGHDAATVAWTMRDADEVSCRAHAGPRTTVGADRTGDLRHARLTGLRADTQYRCRVQDRRTGESRPVRFRTAAPAGTPLRFAVVGDTGDGSRRAHALPASILAGRPDFLVHLGDLAYPDGTATELDERFFAPYREVLARMALFPVPGNHDLGLRGDYREVFSPSADTDDAAGPRWVVDWGAVRLVALASTVITATPDGARWVDAALAATPPGRWRVVVMHEPLYAPPKRKRVTRDLRTTLAPMLEARHVDLVLAGHQHVYARSEPSCEHDPGARVLHVISGGGGSNLDHPTRAEPAFPVVLAVTHHLRVRATSTTLRVRAIDLDGRVLDEVRLTRGATTACRAGGWPRIRGTDRRTPAREP
jgi:hypothetical protein